MNPAQGNSNVETRELVEQLVAYLDGELPAEGVRQIEQRLADDAQAQHELQLLDRSWQLLDSLPAAHVDDRFARSTVEMVAITAQREYQNRLRWAPWRRLGGWALGLAVLAICTALGYTAVARQQGDKNERLLADLPVLEKLEAYRQVVDVEFARLLARLPAESFAVEDNNSGPEPSPEPSAAAPRVDETTAGREARVAALPTAQKQALLRRFERFEGLDPALQDRLRKLDRDIQADPQAAELTAVIDRYYAWVQTLPSFDRAELRDMASGARLAEVQERLAEEGRRREGPRDVADRPSRENIAALSEWFRKDVLPEWQARVEESIPAARRAELKKLEPHQRERALWAESFRVMRHQDKREAGFSAAQLAALEARLVSPAKEQLAAATLDEKQALVRGWFAGMRDQFGSGNFPRQRGFDARHRELMRFSNEELSPEERKELEALPRDQFWRRLGELYAEDRFIRGEPVPDFPPPRPEGDHRPKGVGPPPGRPHERKDKEQSFHREEREDRQGF